MKTDSQCLAYDFHIVMQFVDVICAVTETAFHYNKNSFNVDIMLFGRHIGGWYENVHTEGASQ